MSEQTTASSEVPLDVDVAILGSGIGGLAAARLITIGDEAVSVSLDGARLRLALGRDLDAD